MPRITIYHNPRCSKSRTALKLLEEAGHTPEVVLYLQTPPDKATIADLLRKTGGVRGDLPRKAESLYKELNLANASEQEMIDAMAEHPILIERPVVVYGDQAVVARPPEKTLELLK